MNQHSQPIGASYPTLALVRETLTLLLLLLPHSPQAFSSPEFRAVLLRLLVRVSRARASSHTIFRNGGHAVPIDPHSYLRQALEEIPFDTALEMISVLEDLGVDCNEAGK
jgi:hypothetical protein